MPVSDDTTSPPLKRCTKCGVEYPATSEYFHKQATVKSGLISRCKACQCEYSRHHYKLNGEIVRENRRQYREEHPEKEREYQQYYRKTWPEKNREGVRRRRARRLSLPATFTAEHERLALDYFSGCCAVCGRQLRDLFGTHTANFDHWVPLSKGGGTTPDNMIPLCGGADGCNQSKGTKDAIDWLCKRYGKRKAKQILIRIGIYFEHIRELKR